MKRTTIAALVMAFAVSFGTMTAYADNVKTGTVTATSLNVRTEPSTQAEVLGLLPYGSSVEIHEHIGSWYKIDFMEQVAYIFGDYVAISEKKAQEAMATPQEDWTPSHAWSEEEDAFLKILTQGLEGVMFHSFERDMFSLLKLKGFAKMHCKQTKEESENLNALKDEYIEKYNKIPFLHTERKVSKMIHGVIEEIEYVEKLDSILEKHGYTYEAICEMSDCLHKKYGG